MLDHQILYFLVIGSTICLTLCQWYIIQLEWFYYQTLDIIYCYFIFLLFIVFNKDFNFYFFFKIKETDNFI